MVSTGSECNYYNISYQASKMSLKCVFGEWASYLFSNYVLSGVRLC